MNWYIKEIWMHEDNVFYFRWDDETDNFYVLDVKDNYWVLAGNGNDLVLLKSGVRHHQNYHMLLEEELFMELI